MYRIWFLGIFNSISHIFEKINFTTNFCWFCMMVEISTFRTFHNFWKFIFWAEGVFQNVSFISKMQFSLEVIVSPDCIPGQSRGYFGFSPVTPPPPQRFLWNAISQKIFYLGLSNLVWGYIWGMALSLSFGGLGLQEIGL